MRAVSLRFLVVDIKACLHKATNIKSRKVWYNAYAFRNCRNFLSLSWPAGHICHTYKESFQVRWDNSIPLFLHAAIYLEVPQFWWTSQNAFSRETAVYKWYCVQCCKQLVMKGLNKHNLLSAFILFTLCKWCTKIWPALNPHQISTLPSATNLHLQQNINDKQMPAFLDIYNFR